jgi:hypothetical protein
MLSHQEAQELHLLVGAPLELARQNGAFDPEEVTVKASDLERARELAAILVSDTDPDNEPEDKFTWSDWQSEEEELGSDGRVGVYWIEISDPNGEEYACIIHRTVDGQFPLDGDIAKRKEADAQRIVDALNRK